MPTTFTRAEAGQPLEIAAEAWNASLDAAEAYARDGRPVFNTSVKSGQFPHCLYVTVRNDTGQQIAVGECVTFEELSGGETVLGGSLSDINQGPILVATLHPSNSIGQMTPNYGAALEPIPNGEFGKVCVYGVCAANTTDSASDGNGYATILTTGLGSFFCLTSKRTGIRVLQTLPSNNAIIFIEGGYWQCRANGYGVSVGSNSYVLGDGRGYATFQTTNSDGFVLSDEVLTSSYSSVITTSIIKVPADGIYDVRYDIAGRLSVNNGGGSPRALKTSGASDTTLTISQFAVGLELVVLDNSNVVQTLAHWPSLTASSATRGAEIARIPVTSSDYVGMDWPDYCGGSVSLNLRVNMVTYRKFGVRMSVSSWPTGDAAFVNSEFVPRITLRGTGCAELAVQDLYLAP